MEKVPSYTLRITLLSIDFLKTDADSNIYICCQEHQFIILALYIEDALLIMNYPHHLLSKTKQALCSNFEMTNIGPVTNTTILGLQVSYKKQTKFSKYIY